MHVTMTLEKGPDDVRRAASFVADLPRFLHRWESRYTLCLCMSYLSRSFRYVIPILTAG